MRITSIEFFRIIAIFAVVLLHTSPFRNSGNSIYEFLYIGISNSTRFAVPYFFIIAGYFFGKKIQGGTSPTSLFRLYAARLFPLFLIWTIFYIIFPTDIKKQVINLGLWEAMYQKVYGIFSDPTLCANISETLPTM